jgi:hypothetical protein
MSSASRVVTALVLAGVIAGGVTACGTEEQSKPAGSASATPHPAETPAPTEPTKPTTDATPAPRATSAPIEVDCSGLLSLQVMYDYNANFSLDESYVPDIATEVGQVAELGGLACAWENQTSGEVLEVGVASLEDGPLTNLKNNFVMNSQPVPTFGDPTVVEGYFTKDGEVGQAEAFAGPFWVSVNSTALSEPGDAEPIMSAALAALGQ